MMCGQCALTTEEDHREERCFAQVSIKCGRAVWPAVKTPRLHGAFLRNLPVVALETLSRKSAVANHSEAG
ncbi:hypothetical protein FGO68_gene5127 [Halteria grandinella]|uniref:Uncharacterized protein n=1 Tax=Halteria grandinella TaxID=5974 RepID=A0A8J8SUJ4_HALGN|nr:hypothetical protein FGO68_gene5127 [Halteria grandinella]